MQDLRSEVVPQPIRRTVLRTVRINASELRNKLVENRAAHTADYEKAFVVYRDDVVAALKARLESVEHREPFNLYFNLRSPEDHTADYDRVIAMLNMSVEKEVDLSSDEFNCYVLDNWEWAENAKMLNSSYSSRAIR
jgi:hypothetical protein